MSPELETLDQLLSDNMPLAMIRSVYPDDAQFFRGMRGLLVNGDVRLLQQGMEVPSWRRDEVLRGEWANVMVTLTDAGATRIE